MGVSEKGFQVSGEQGSPVDWTAPLAAGEGKPEVRSGELFKSRMQDILDAMEDANYNPSEILKLIALEQAAVVNQMSSQKTEFSIGGQGKRLDTKMKALTELRKTVQEAEELSKKDILNVDGIKFEFVFNLLCEWMTESIAGNGLSQEQNNNIMKTFRDKVTTGEAQMRKDVEKLDSNR
jgi:hypothetical protein